MHILSLRSCEQTDEESAVSGGLGFVSASSLPTSRLE